MDKANSRPMTKSSSMPNDFLSSNSVRKLHEKVEERARQKSDEHCGATNGGGSFNNTGTSSNRMLSSHYSVYQALENSKLDTLAIHSEGIERTNSNNSNDVAEFPSTFSLTSWQSVGSISNNVDSPQRLSMVNFDTYGNVSSDKSSEKGPSARSILSLSSDETKEQVSGLRHEESSAKIKTFINTPTKNSDAEQSDDSGTFEINLNKDIEKMVDLKEYKSTMLTSPSLVMPKMLMTASDRTKIKRKTIRVCVVGNYASRIQKRLDELKNVRDNIKYSYLFTNLNQAVDLVILVFEPGNGLFNKELFNVLSSSQKSILPIIYSRGEAKIENGNYTDEDGEKENGLYSESVIVTLLQNNNIKLFNSPIRIHDREPLSFANLNSIITNHFGELYSEQVFSDNDEFEDSDQDVIDENLDAQMSTSLWASTIIQSRSSPSASRRKSSNATVTLNSSGLDKSRRKRLDKKRLSMSQINNSDPLKITDGKDYFLGVGVGIGLVAFIASVYWYNSTCGVGNSGNEQLKLKLLRNEKLHENGMELFMDSLKRMIYSTKVCFFNSYYYLREVLVKFGLATI